MRSDNLRRVRDELATLARSGLDRVSFVSAASEAVGRVVPYDRSCWHAVDPGTVLFTGSINRNVGCSGSWLAEHEYYEQSGAGGFPPVLAATGPLSRGPITRGPAVSSSPPSDTDECSLTNWR